MTRAIILGSVTVVVFFAYFAFAQWLKLSLIGGWLPPVYILSVALGFAFRRHGLAYIVPVGYLLALAVYWLTLCGACGYDIGHWETFAVLAFVGLPTWFFAILGATVGTRILRALGWNGQVVGKG